MNYLTQTQKNEALRIATAFKAKQIKQGLKNPKNSDNLNVILLESLSIKNEKKDNIFGALFCFLICNLMNLPMWCLISKGFNLGDFIGALIFAFIFLSISCSIETSSNN
jgi:hypothetical protein